MYPINYINLYRCTTSTTNTTNGTYIKEVLLPTELRKYLYAAPLISYFDYYYFFQLSGINAPTIPARPTPTVIIVS